MVDFGLETATVILKPEASRSKCHFRCIAGYVEYNLTGYAVTLKERKRSSGPKDAVYGWTLGSHNCRSTQFYLNPRGRAQADQGHYDMWYSTLSVGVLEIDLQHANIDQVLLELTNNNMQETVDRVTGALVLHFQAEERLCAEKGLHMSADHEKEHVRLVEILKKLQQQIHDETPDCETVLRTYSNLLVQHVTLFDSTISDSGTANYEPHT